MRNFEPDYGRAVKVAAMVRRVTAHNPGPFTFAGTNTYLVGSREIAIIDPGPSDTAHIDALLNAAAGGTVTHVLLTHTHRDHTDAVSAVIAATGARTVEGGPHRAARSRQADEPNPLDAATDRDFRPDIILGKGSSIAGEGWSLEAIPTPGHTANHLAFALVGTDTIFTGDHVMGWSSTIVAPPDGAMADYMASLETMMARPETHYLPGHGDAIADGHARVAALKAHRLSRERAILRVLRDGVRTIPELVAEIYADTDPRLHGAAALSVLAHLEDLTRRGMVTVDAGSQGGSMDRYRLE